MTIQEIYKLLRTLKEDIPDKKDWEPGWLGDEEEEPYLDVTIATTNATEWGWQTGDNSFHGSCYFYQHWHVLTLFHNSNCLELAREAKEELLDLIYEHQQYQTQ